MNTYLIDYENTTTNGLKGIEKLSSADHVIIFYGNNPAALPFHTHIQLIQTKATIDYVKTEKVGKNYLDFQLSTYCGYLIGTTRTPRYVIISKDAGYDSIIDFWRNKKPDILFERQPSIELSLPTKQTSISPIPKVAPSLLPPTQHTASKAPLLQSAPQSTAKQQPAAVRKLSESYKKKIRAKIKAENLKGGSYNSIYNLFLKSNSKQHLNIGLVKAFQQERGNHLYKLLLPEFEGFLGTK